MFKSILLCLIVPDKSHNAMADYQLAIPTTHLECNDLYKGAIQTILLLPPRELGNVFSLLLETEMMEAIEIQETESTAQLAKPCCFARKSQFVLGF